MIIKGGLVALAGEPYPVRVDIRVKNGIIVEIADDIDCKTHDCEMVDARGQFVLPGGIDPHVHFNDPGYEAHEDFYTGTAFAASGGITTVIDMPCTSIPPVTDKSKLRTKLDIVSKKALIDFGFYGGVSAQSIADGFPDNVIGMADDILGIKVYMTSGMDIFGHLDHYRLKTVMQLAKSLDLPVLIHAEDYEYVQNATQAEMKIGNKPINYYNSRPEIAEALAIKTACLIAKEVGAKVHIVHIGTASAAGDLDGSLISGETCPQYLDFSLEDFEALGSRLKVAPSIKSSLNSFGLWDLVRSGKISFLASDHAPATAAEKNTGSIWTDYSGIPGCGTLLPYTFSEGYTKSIIDFQTMVNITSTAASKRYGIDDRKGSIELGKDADFAIIDPEMTWKINGAEFFSKGKITPFEGREFIGRVVKTILRGKVVYDYRVGLLQSAGYGNFLRRKGF